MTIEELAKQTLAVLDKQQEYFATRSSSILQESKKMERELRYKCNDIIAGINERPTLF